MKRHLLIPLALAAASAARASVQDTPIDLLEDFAYATDRARVVAEALVPGSVEAFYFAALLAQHRGELAEADRLLAAWAARHAGAQADERYRELADRQALLVYDVDPERTLTHLRGVLDVDFDARDGAGMPASTLPTALDPQLVTSEAFLGRALTQPEGAIAELRGRALATLAARDLPLALRRDLLDRLARPDVPNLATLVVRDLVERAGAHFGDRGVHRLLLVEQLDACAGQRPELLEDKAFVRTYLKRLAPGADARADAPDVRRAHLARLAAFAARLGREFDGLRAHVLAHQLHADLAAGVVDRATLLAYLRLPRATDDAEPGHLRGLAPVDLTVDWGTGLPPVGDDRALVREALLAALAREADVEAFVGPVRRDVLTRLFAEAKLLAGVPDTEGGAAGWTALLPAEEVEALRARVELRFARGQRTHFGVAEPVTLAVDVKHVPELLVRVFEVDTAGHLLALASTTQGLIPPIGLDLDVDGLVPHTENTHVFDTAPMQRVRREFALPGLERRGVFVIELVGNGLASRALIRKGDLTCIERTSAAGHVFRVFDEAGRHVRSASVHIGAREFHADAEGEVIVPFTSEPRLRSAVLRDGDFAASAEFEHAAEEYTLEAGMHVARETLLTGGTARLIVRPRLAVAGARASVALLRDVRLVLTATDIDGTPTTTSVEGVALRDDRDFVHTLRVPPRLQSLSATLQASVDALSDGSERALTSRTATFRLNSLDTTHELANVLLTETPAGYFLDVLGRNGEPLAARALSLSVEHADYRSPHTVRLATDEAGRVALGLLPGIVAVQVAGLGAEPVLLPLRPPHTRGRVPVVHALAGAPLRVPCTPPLHAGGAAGFSLIERRGGAFAARVTPAHRFVDGQLELSGLAPGDYSLALAESGETFEVRVTAPSADSSVAARRLELTPAQPLTIASAELGAAGLDVRLVGATRETRAHVFVTRTLPAFDALGSGLGLGLDPLRTPEVLALEPPMSSFVSERALGDELRYVLDRRRAAKFPGNMLARTGLLLNPWAIEHATLDVLGLAGGAGGAYGGRIGGTRNSKAAGRAAPDSSELTGRPASSANLDFLAAPGVQLENLVPDAEGRIRVPFAALGDGHVVEVVVIDGAVAFARRLVRDERPLARRDLRFVSALDPARPVLPERRIRHVAAGDRVALGSAPQSEARTFDTLADVFALFRTILGDVALARFDFLTRWPSLTLDERRALYSEHACHELAVFVAEKDPEFFAAVVRPYLANKHAKEFLDDYLLGNDLSAYTEPWAFAGLNIVERILLLRGLGADAARDARELLALVPRESSRAEQSWRFAYFGAALDAESAGLPGASVPASTGATAEKYENVPEEAPKGTTGAPDEPGAPDESGAAREAEFADTITAFDIPVESVELLTRGLEQRKQQRAFHRALAPTQELAERGYWGIRRNAQGPTLVTISPFWLDFAATPVGTPFVSTAFPSAARSVNEALLALALLDLPFEAGAHVRESTPEGAALVAASDLFVATDELVPATPAAGTTRVLVGQDTLRLDQPTIVVDGRERDRLVTGELVQGVVYTSRLVVTNPSAAPLDVDLLAEVPRGAIALGGGPARLTARVTLAPYASHSRLQPYYFPAAGTFTQFPLHVGVDGALIAHASPRSFDVVARPSTPDTTSWEAVAREASLEDLLAHLAAANPRQLDLRRLAPRLHDEETFARVTQHLAERHVFDTTVWSFALLHGDRVRLREYLATRTDWLARLDGGLVSPLVTLDPVARGWYEHLEYAPLVNARVHDFGSGTRIHNEALRAQYTRFLRLLAHEPELRAEHRLAAAYYLFLQDRVREALAMFDRVDPDQLDERLQYDALHVQAAFHRADTALARAVASRHVDHPVTRWREWFQGALAQLDEAEGRAPGEGRAGPDALESLVASEPTLELAVEGGLVTVTTANVAAIELAYRALDLELLFSTNPFLEVGVGALGSIKPVHTETVAVRAGEPTVVALPAALAGRDLLVEARASGIVRRAVHDSSALAVRTFESYGQVEVRTATSRALLPRAYVKVYARLADGTVRFHKDGYTDLRGRFDYASVSGSEGPPVARFALFVQHDDHGAELREVAPPTR